MSISFIAYSTAVYDNVTYTHALQQVLGLLVHVQHARLRVLGEVERRHLWHELILPLTLLFLQSEGDTADGATLDTLHQVGGVTGDLRVTSVSIMYSDVRR